MMMDRKDLKQDKLFNIADKIKGTKKCNQNFVVELKGWELKYSYFQEHGFENPLLVKDKSGLGMRIPSQNFTMNDIKKCVGSKKVVQVLTSRGEKKGMTTKEFAKHLETRRDEISALARFDFSETKLETYVEQPEVVQLLDWSNFLAPSDGELPEGRPKVQRFCSMTLSGHFDDFDLSPSSQWIHLLRGKIVLWLIRPSTESYESFSEWKKTLEQKTFLGDSVTACQRLKVEHGWTLFIPSGWIIGQYTTEDALMIGGTFLNSFSMANQIRAHKLLGELNDRDVDDALLFSRKLWYVLDSYLTSILGHSRRLRSGSEVNIVGGQNVEGREKVMLSSNEDTDVEEAVLETEEARLQNSEKCREDEKSASLAKASSSSAPSTSNIIKVVTVKLENCLLTQKQIKNEANVFPTNHELEGMKSVIEFLLDEGLSSLPSDLHHHEDIINDVKKLLQDYMAINHPKSTITGRPIMSLTHREVTNLDSSSKPPSTFNSDQQIQVTDQQSRLHPHPLVSVDVTASSASQVVCFGSGGPTAEAGTHLGHPDAWSGPGRESVLRRRRVRCKRCEPCTRGECGECHFCRDMKKFGGQGKMKQTCISRQCLAPILSTSAVCSLCGKGDHLLPSSSSSSLFGQVNLVSGDATTTMADDSRPHPDQSTEASSSKSLPLRSFDSTAGKNCPNVASGNELMECSICWKITHPLCYKLRHPELAGVEAVINEDLPNSWDCPGCCEAGKSGQKKPRPNKLSALPSMPVASSSSSLLLSMALTSPQKKKEFTSESEDDEDSESLSSDPNLLLLLGNSGKDRILSKKTTTMTPHDVESAETRKRSWNEGVEDGIEDKKLKMLSDNQTTKDSEVAASFSLSGSTKCPQSSVFNPSINLPSMTSSSSSSEKIKESPMSYPSGPHAPQFVVRPIFSAPPPKFLPTDGNGPTDHPLVMEHWLRIFGWLGPRDLSVCMLVCRTWNCWCYYVPLWRSMDVSRRRIKKVHLIALAKRQPEILDLSHTNVSKEQMSWLSERLFRLRRLNLEGCSRSAVGSLCFNGSCPVLTHLDLSWVSNLNDQLLRALLSPSTDNKPGSTSSGCRLQNLVELKLVGTEVGDASLELLSKILTKLRVLDLSYCLEITSKALEFLTNGTSPTPTPANQQTPSKHQALQLSTNKSHQSKYSPVTVQGVPPPHQSLAAIHNPCIQSISSPASSSSSSPPTTSSNSQQEQGCTPNSNVSTNASISISLAPPYHDLMLMLPLSQLRKLLLIGCSWIDGAVVSETRTARPQMEIVHSTENLQ